MSAKERFLLHYSDQTNWRLRNLEEHPFDPGWEVGTYSVCHPQIRARTTPKTKIFDVAVRDGKPVIRSAFVVNRTRGEEINRVLYFDEFYFADGEPTELPGPFIQYRCMTMDTCVSKYGLKTLWGDIVKNYASYKKGQRPKSVDVESWRLMVNETQKIRKQKQCGKKVQSKDAKKRCK